MKRGRAFWTILFSSILIITMIFALTIGVAQISFLETFQIIFSELGFSLNVSHIPQSHILTMMQLRLPRVLMSILAGGALAASGAVFQSVFKNPICDPYVLGISSGASLGAAIAFILGWNYYLFGVTIPALVTALLTLGIIVSLYSTSFKRETYTILLVGIALNFLISAIITFLMVTHQQEMQKIIFWTMGSLTAVNWFDLLLFTPLCIISLYFLFYYSKSLNIIQVGDAEAQSLGVNVNKTVIVSLLFSSILIAGVVSLCGVIGFIGLIVPHIVRILFGNHLKNVMLYSLFFGALFLLLADTLARIIVENSELPVGSITAIIGAPYFIYLLLKNKQKLSI